MLKSYLIAVIGISGVMVLWAFIQRVWGSLFFPELPGADALEHRISCGKCGCVTPCTRSDSLESEKGRVSIEGSDGA